MALSPKRIINFNILVSPPNIIHWPFSTLSPISLPPPTLPPPPNCIVSPRRGVRGRREDVERKSLCTDETLPDNTSTGVPSMT